MGKKRVKFTFNGEMIKEPVIYRLGRTFEIVTNIRRADVGDASWAGCCSSWTVRNLRYNEASTG